MHNCKPMNMAVDVNTKLQPATDQDEPFKRNEYQSAVGSLMYLTVCTRPDIAYAENYLARFNSNPQKMHWTALKRVLRYLKGTIRLAFFTSKIAWSSVMGIVMVTRPEISQTENKPLATSSNSAQELFLGGVVSRSG